MKRHSADKLTATELRKSLSLTPEEQKEVDAIVDRLLSKEQ